MKQLAFDFSVTAAPTLDNFAVGRNAELVEHLRALVAARTSERFLYLWGPPGSGRSHLVRATLAAFKASGASVCHIACDAAMTFPDSHDRIAVAGVEDVERLSDAGQIGLFNLYNALSESGAALLVCGNAPPSRLELRPELMTRLGWCLVYEVHCLDDDEKAQALAEHAALRGFTLPPDVCHYLLTHVRRDMASLLALVDTLDRYSLEAQRPVTVPLARALLTRHSERL
ncbi:MAG: DnaA regulatory inactivator Hda [Burkholderiales bacterium]